jgi:hypothetical protein
MGKNITAISLLTLASGKGYLARTSPLWVSTLGRKAAPLCAAFAFYTPTANSVKGVQ